MKGGGSVGEEVVGGDRSKISALVVERVSRRELRMNMNTR